MVKFNLFMTPEQIERLRYQARRRGVSVSAIVREAVDAEISRSRRTKPLIRLRQDRRL
jgi:hypothetical protein